MSIVRLPALVLALALAGCATAPQSAAPPATAAAADDNLNAVAWVQTSAEYRMLAMQTYRSAAALLDAALADPDWDALLPEDRLVPARGLAPAVVLDIDETVLDNSPYQARLVRDGGEYDEASWDAWVREEAAGAVPGALAFTRAAAARGIEVIYVSNRAAHLEAATLANLRALGFPVGEPERVFYGLGRHIEGCEQHGSEKGCRRQAVSRDYRVLMQIGDQLGDFATIDANTPAARAALLEAHADWIGSRWWALPGPTYGSWEPALFGNDWRQPREARRAAKRAALQFSEG
ncbi:5'-nucleotidase, lipoprotein e(P4) family [Coralloluteibacterium thermophilus]|uniref:5'-nucleotidase, lipoprotein e(P4) family n=1 Tax=Coralloluteibacterium thermophilum TaxID=2707049 RepID=A0ABV9NMH9_9GAMM